MRPAIFLGQVLLLLCVLAGCGGQSDKPAKPSIKPAAKTLIYPVAGKPAPEIDGEDLDGNYFRLSEFKGKVVVIDFWGMWCGPCTAFFPHGRSLVKTYSKRPFVLLGVNTDRDRKKPLAAVEAGKVTWRSWWDGGVDGPITQRWVKSGFPTLYVIDAEGIIRHYSIGLPQGKAAEELDEKIESLVKKAEGKS